MTDKAKIKRTSLPLADFLKLTIDYNADLLHFLHASTDSAFERVRPVVPPKLFDRLPRSLIPANEDDVFGEEAREYLRLVDGERGGRGVPIIGWEEEGDEGEEGEGEEDESEEGEGEESEGEQGEGEEG